MAWVVSQQRCADKCEELSQRFRECSLTDGSVALSKTIGECIKPGGSFSRSAFEALLSKLQQMQCAADKRLRKLEPGLAARPYGERIKAAEVSSSSEVFRRLCNSLTGFWNLVDQILREHRAKAAFGTSKAKTGGAPAKPTRPATDRKGDRLSKVGKGGNSQVRGSKAGATTRASEKGASPDEPVDDIFIEGVCKPLRSAYMQVYLGDLDLARRSNGEASKFVRAVCKGLSPVTPSKAYNELARHAHPYCGNSSCCHEDILHALSGVGRNRKVLWSQVPTGPSCQEDSASTGGDKVHAKEALVTGSSNDSIISDVFVDARDFVTSGDGNRSSATRGCRSDGAEIADDRHVHEQSARHPVDLKGPGSKNARGGGGAAPAKTYAGAAKEAPLHSNQLRNGPLPRGGRSFRTPEQPRRSAAKGALVRETRVVEPLAEANIVSVAKGMKDRLGGQGSRVQPRQPEPAGSAQEGSQVGPPATTRANPGKSMQRQKGNSRRSAPRDVLESRSPRGLSTQPAEGGRGKSAGKSPSNGRGNGAVVTPNRRQNDAIPKTGGPNTRLAHLNIKVSPKQAKALQSSGPVVVRLWSGKARLGDFSICKVGKAENNGQGWGPQNDTSPNPQIQPPVGDVHKSRGKQPLPTGRSGPVKDRNTSKNDSKGPQSHTEGSSIEESVGCIPEASGGSVRPESVGHACGSGTPSCDASLVPKCVPECRLPVTITTSDSKQVSNKQRLALHRGRWCDVGGHDDSPRQLRCGYCDTHNVPSAVKARCRDNRRRYLRRLRQAEYRISQGLVQPRSSDLAQINQNRPEIKIVRKGKQDRSEPGQEQPSLVSDSRRWGRPRSDLRRGSLPTTGRNPPSVVGTRRSLSESGGDGQQVSPDRVLSAQTPQNSERLGDGSESEESLGYVMCGDRPIQGQTSPVLINSLESESSAPQRRSHTRSLLSESSLPSKDRVNTTSKNKAAKRNRQPISLDASAAPGGPTTRANTRGKNDGVGAVGDKSRRAANDRKLADKSPKVQRAQSYCGNEDTIPGRDLPLAAIENSQLSPGLIRIEGDATELVDAGFLYHCIGADATFGAGIAKAINKKFPGVKGAVRSEKHLSEGVVVPVVYGGITIMNAVTKKKSGIPSLQQHSNQNEAIDIIYDTLCQSISFAQEQGATTIAVPWLPGAGLDKLNPVLVEQMLQAAARMTNMRIVAYHLGAENTLRQAGDVEENPGPSRFAIAALRVVAEYVKPHSWEKVTITRPAVKVTARRVFDGVAHNDTVIVERVKIPQPVWKPCYEKGDLLRAARDMGKGARKSVGAGWKRVSRPLKLSLLPTLIVAQEGGVLANPRPRSRMDEISGIVHRMFMWSSNMERIRSRNAEIADLRVQLLSTGSVADTMRVTLRLDQLVREIAELSAENFEHRREVNDAQGRLRYHAAQE